jgi:hypothetical protein
MSANDPESYSNGSVATGEGFHAGQVKGDDPDIKRISWSCRLGVAACG